MQSAIGKTSLECIFMCKIQLIRTIHILIKFITICFLDFITSSKFDIQFGFLKVNILESIYIAHICFIFLFFYWILKCGLAID